MVDAADLKSSSFSLVDWLLDRGWGRWLGWVLPRCIYKLILVVGT